jgi:hypothetical protein
VSDKVEKKVVFKGDAKAAGKTDVITVRFKGTKRFRQAVVDAVYKALMEDGLIEDAGKAGCGLAFDTSMIPSEEIQ